MYEYDIYTLLLLYLLTLELSSSLSISVLSFTPSASGTAMDGNSGVDTSPPSPLDASFKDSDGNSGFYFRLHPHLMNLL